MQNDTNKDGNWAGADRVTNRATRQDLEQTFQRFEALFKDAENMLAELKKQL